MPITIFNPPCPHADPVVGGLRDDTVGRSPCGQCVGVPRCYEVIAGAAQGGAYPAAFFGKHVLQRDLAKYRTDNQELCNWFCPIQVDGLLVNLPSYPCGWSLYYLDSVRGWECRAAGQSYVGDAPPQDVAFYTLRAPGHPQVFFNCLKPTTFFFDSSFGSAQALGVLPSSIIVQPFWP